VVHVSRLRLRHSSLVVINRVTLHQSAASITLFYCLKSYLSLSARQGEARALSLFASLATICTALLGRATPGPQGLGIPPAWSPGQPKPGLLCGLWGALGRALLQLPMFLERMRIRAHRLVGRHRLLSTVAGQLPCSFYSMYDPACATTSLAHHVQTCLFVRN
jgi:hypothetical protein